MITGWVVFAPVQAGRIDAEFDLGADGLQFVGRLLQQFLDVRRINTRPSHWPTASLQIDAITGVLPPAVGITTQGLSSRTRRCS